jgi:hypothetical protein
MNTLQLLAPGFSSATPPPRRIPITPRLPRQQRAAPPTPTQYSEAAATLRQKTLGLVLQAMEANCLQDDVRYEQLMAEAGSFNTAACWLAAQSYPAGVQAGHPLCP